MKFGVILHSETGNLGDDIQTYAASKLLPSVDYVIDREHLDSFESENNEPVAAVLAHWWFWQKWNWPPADCIVPLLISMHINNYDIYNRGTPMKDRWLEGPGGEYMKAYGPVGVRDMTSLDFFKERGFDAYFSGCMTLTLPKQKETKDAGQYFVIADMNPTLKKKAHEILDPLGLKVIEITHDCHYRGSSATFEERMAEVERVLTIYQNARCVFTRRLHVSLPCLAMGVPVLSVVDLSQAGNFTRWSPYAEWLHYVSNEDFLAGKFEYDPMNPPENKPDYLETREGLIRAVSDFVEKYKDDTRTTEELKKTTATRQEVKDWQYDIMKWCLEEWLHDSRGMMKKYNDSKKKVKDLEKKLKAEGKVVIEEKKTGKGLLDRLLGR